MRSPSGRYVLYRAIIRGDLVPPRAGAVCVPRRAWEQVGGGEADGSCWDVAPARREHPSMYGGDS